MYKAFKERQGKVEFQEMRHLFQLLIIAGSALIEIKPLCRHVGTMFMLREGAWAQEQQCLLSAA